MSYCRFIGSDAYIYPSRRGIECCGCTLVEPIPLEEPHIDIFGIAWEHEFPEVVFKTSRAALQHIAEHRAAGDYIPTTADEGIKQDYPDLDKEIEDD